MVFGSSMGATYLGCNDVHRCDCEEFGEWGRCKCGMEYTLHSICCFAEMDSWESHCPECKEGTGCVKVYEDGSEEDC